MTIYGLALRQQFASWLIWAIIIVLGVQTLTAAAPAVASSRALVEMMSGLPASVRHLMGGDLMFRRPLDGYLYVKLVMYLPLLVGIFTGLQASSLLAREMESRRFDFLLGLPLTRRSLVLTRFAALATAQAAMWTITVGALILFMGRSDLRPDTAGYVLVGYSGFLVTLATGAGALWASAGARDYRTAVRLGLLIAVVPFVYDLVVRIATPVPLWRYILPYGYYDPPHLLLTHAFPWLATAVLVLATLGLMYGALHAFERREV